MKGAGTRRAFIGTVCGVAGGAMAGCLGASVEGNDSERTFRMIGSPIRTLDPVAANDGASYRVITQLFDGLLQYPKGNPEPELLLADDVTVSDDERTYTFTLKDDVTFNDGSTLSASDVVYSFERVAVSPHSTHASLLFDHLGVEHERKGDEYVPGTLGVEAMDRKTVELRLESPFYATLDVLALPSLAIVPEGIVGDVPGYDGRMPRKEFATETPVGAGAFTFDYWQSDAEYAVTARDDYHGDGPHVDGIHWHVMSNPTAGYTYATNENADAFWVPNSKFDPAKVTIETIDEQGRKIGTYGPLPENGRTVRYVQVPLATTYYIGFNTQRVPKPVRKAVAHVMNQEQEVEDVRKDRGESAVHLTPPSIFPGGVESAMEHATSYPYGRDESKLDEARAVMERAGYGSDDRERFTITTYQSSSWSQTAKLLQDKLRAVYIDLEIEQASFPTLAERGRNGTLEAFSYGWVMDYPSPETFLKLLAPRNTTDSFLFWEDTAAANRAKRAWNRVLDHRSSSEADAKARHEAYIEMEEANWEDVALIPTFYPVGEGFYYQWVNIPKTGAAGFAKHKYTDVTIDRRP
ncbi:ABC transporter substrate-binding protein [Haladaptatus caseinilyticus]|uniref:ABC transporter substrate-binding protein n=1 Tax=Haladaptatus caseinilyticus TaxID=2993314 RepID=UPI00224A637F|nr:ABC transporter substrate-binding protein [Haladaptatus caseinilyticus]